jgi:hypothetical protein
MRRVTLVSWMSVLWLLLWGVVRCWDQIAAILLLISACMVLILSGCGQRCGCGHRVLPVQLMRWVTLVSGGLHVHVYTTWYVCRGRGL